MYPPLAVFLQHAYVSLGTFFALSGFLLTKGYLGRCWTRRETGRYFVARFARIYPLYAFSLIVVAPIIAGQLSSGDFGSFWNRIRILLSYVLLLQGWLKLPVDWNTPAWSLSCEIFFYSLFPILLFLVRKKSWRSTMLITVLAFAVTVLVHESGLPREWKAFSYLGDFLIGIAAATIYDRMVALRPDFQGRGDLLSIPALAGGVLLVAYGHDLHPWLLFDESIRLANGALVVGLALGGGTLARLLSTRAFMMGGKASYAIYILHVPILWWFKRFPMIGAVPPLLAGIAYVLLAVSAAMVVSRLVEYPANRAVREKLNNLFFGRAEPRSSRQLDGAFVAD